MKNKKVTIIGTGNVGSSFAYILALSGICKEIVLKDIREEYTKGLALDISQAVIAANLDTKVSYASDKTSITKDSDIVVITAGSPRLDGMTRKDLLFKNADILKSIANEIKEYCPNAIIIVVSNPLDAMVYAMLKMTNFPKNKVLGMAGVLDSARMNHAIFEKLGYGLGKIKTMVIGEHGDEMLPLPRFSAVNETILNDLLNVNEIEDVIHNTKKGGARIIEHLGTSAYFAPANSIFIMIKAILNDTKEVYPCSVLLEGEYGFSGVTSGVPVVLGKNGIEKIVKLELNEDEKILFAKSIKSVENMIDALNKSEVLK